MDDLRTRIACVLAGITPNNTPKPEYVEMADAIIREIGLRQENGHYDGFFGRKERHRYVTDWIPDTPT